MNYTFDTQFGKILEKKKLRNRHLLSFHSILVHLCDNSDKTITIEFQYRLQVNNFTRLKKNNK